MSFIQNVWTLPVPKMNSIPSFAPSDGRNESPRVCSSAVDAISTVKVAPSILNCSSASGGFSPADDSRGSGARGRGGATCRRRRALTCALNGNVRLRQAADSRVPKKTCHHAPMAMMNRMSAAMNDMSIIFLRRDITLYISIVAPLMLSFAPFPKRRPNATMPNATATFSDSFFPIIGISRMRSAARRMDGGNPFTSLPRMIATRAPHRHSRAARGQGARPLGSTAPTALIARARRSHILLSLIA